MLESPGFELSFQLSAELESQSSIHPELEIEEDLKEPNEEVEQRVRSILDRRVEVLGLRNAARKIAIRSSLPLHHGLGAGTQLGCTVAAGMELAEQFVRVGSQSLNSKELPMASRIPSEQWLAHASGRGRRSGIGLSGFLRGGLILDEGYPAGAAADPTRTRVVDTQATSLPYNWRVLLLTPNDSHTVHGEYEANMLAEIAEHPTPERELMRRIAHRIFFRLHENCELQEFAQLLEQYTAIAGSMFDGIQGGRYSSPAIEDAAELAARVGLVGVGQSSWGPVVFGFCQVSQAEEISDRIAEQQFSGSTQTCSIANTGAKFRFSTSKLASDSA
ncbi:MAG: hypothetical protein VXZ82_08650 [Planctomycetota bacterium]|nr:hypothetical protein [Planctomycetota bacterium]